MDARFTVDGHGNVTPSDAEARKLLGTRTGNFLLAPTTPDLLCFVRTPPSGAKSSAPRVVLCGDAGGFPVSDLIAFLGQSRWSGVVRVQSPSGDRSIFLREGEVRGAASDSPEDRIGEVMVRLGYVTRERLDALLDSTPPSKVGRALVEKGVLQAHDLFKCLTEQVSEIFHAMVLCKEGVFFLIEQELEEKSLHTLNLSMQSLLMDSIRKIDEMAHFRKRIPHGRVYVAKKRASDGSLEKDEDRVLGLCDGQKTVLELGQAAKLSEFDVTRAVYRLLEGGYAQVSERAVATGPTEHPAPVPVEDLPRATAQVFNVVFAEIRSEVAKQGLERELIDAANAALAGQGLTASPVLQGLELSPDGSLPEDELIAQFEKVKAELGSEPLGAFKQALSDVMFFLLFQAGELLESRADEDLARRVKELLATLEQR
ncbi:MAG: DUF4388 domain-containing protein [Myxococcota bacterium]